MTTRVAPLFLLAVLVELVGSRVTSRACPRPTAASRRAGATLDDKMILSFESDFGPMGFDSLFLRVRPDSEDAPAPKPAEPRKRARTGKFWSNLFKNELTAERLPPPERWSQLYTQHQIA